MCCFLPSLTVAQSILGVCVCVSIQNKVGFDRAGNSSCFATALPRPRVGGYGFVCLPANPAWLKCLEPCIHEDLWITIVSTDFFFPPQFIKHPVKVQRLICSAHPPSLPHLYEAPKEYYCAEWPHAGFLRTVILLSGGRLQRPWQNYQNVCLQETIKQSLNSLSPPLILPFCPTSPAFLQALELHTHIYTQQL